MASKPKVVIQPNDQPEGDPQLKQAVHSAVAGAEKDAQTGNVATAKSPEASVPDAPAYQGHDRR